MTEQSWKILAKFPHADGSRVPYTVFSDEDIYALEQARIYRGETWNFLGFAVEIPEVGDFKSTFVGDTPVVMTRTEDGSLAAWVNRCAHRGAMVCRLKRGNALSHSCVYHQWSYNTKGDLQGVPFRRGQKGTTGMPPDFDPKQHSLRQLRVENYRGLVFATFSEAVVPFGEYIGPTMRHYIDRLFHKPIVYLGCTRQYSDSNWKLYTENVKDPYHASLLHLFTATFGIFRVGMKARCVTDEIDGLHSLIFVTKNAEEANSEVYKEQNIRSYDEGFHLEDPSILALEKEFEEAASTSIQSIFPQLILQQIHNTLCARQILPKGHNHYELIFHYFGYEDDTPEMRDLRIKQANLVGPAGYVSMEDTEATELVQRGTARDRQEHSIIDMARTAPHEEDTMITENLIRKFWVGYQKIMGFEVAPAATQEK
nr:anthranilate 1,2-dioxygenase large subunit AndAc [uncultured Pseudomonas sp.]